MMDVAKMKFVLWDELKNGVAMTDKKSIFKKIRTKVTAFINFFNRKRVKNTLFAIAGGIIVLYFVVTLFTDFVNYGYSLLLGDRIAEIKSLTIKEVEKIDRINELRFKSWQVVGGFVGFILVVVQIYRTITFNKQVNEQRRANINALTLDQYVRAVDQLKDENMAVRLGGIYSLEQIMNSENKEDYKFHDVIIELFCAYVREERPFDEEDYKINPSKYKVKVLTDIRAILTVLGRRVNKDDEKVEIDLKHTNWNDADLSNMKLEGFNLSGAHLEGANLNGANLEHAKLMEAHLEGADLYGANLEHAKLMEAHLEGADLNGANLEHAKLINTHLEGADLKIAHLEGADLRIAHLEGANLTVADLEGADLSGVHLERADLTRADLAGAILTGAHLAGANLTGADLAGAILFKAHLSGADLEKVNFKDIKLVSRFQVRAETEEDRITFIRELENAIDVEGIELDNRIMDLIEKKFPDLLKRINDDKN